jgi:hypothetical protein
MGGVLRRIRPRDTAAVIRHRRLSRLPEVRRVGDVVGGPNVELTRKEARRIAEMVNALPDAIFASGTSELMQQAGIECFFGHARTLIEFLLIKPSGHSFDLTARHTLAKSAWTPELEPDGQLKKKLTTTWWMASQHQAHFTINRPAELPYGQSDLREIADELLSVWDQFATASDHPDVPHRTDFSMFR